MDNDKFQLLKRIIPALKSSNVPVFRYCKRRKPAFVHFFCWITKQQNVHGPAYFMTVLYTNIDLKLRNKSHGPMHCKIGVTCVYIGHVFYTLL